MSTRNKKRKRTPKPKFNPEALLAQMPPETPPGSRTTSGAELAEIFGDLDIDYSTQQPKLKAKQTQTTPEGKSNIGRSLDFSSEESAVTPIRPIPLRAEKTITLGGRRTRRKKRRRKTKKRRKTKRKKRRRKRKTKKRRR